MHRLPRRDLEATIFVVMATAPASIKRGLKSKLLTDRERARMELTTLICDKIDNESSMVVVAELIGDAVNRRRGQWDVDEPVPAIVPADPPPPTA